MGFKNGKVILNVFISTIVPNASYALKDEVGSDSGWFQKTGSAC